LAGWKLTTAAEGWRGHAKGNSLDHGAARGIYLLLSKEAESLNMLHS
jgi:hypothetical protein